jgi:hypothetical protein
VMADLACRGIHGIDILHEESQATSGRAFEIYAALKAVKSWPLRTKLKKFSVGDKSIMALQGADLVAREAFKHVDNLGIRATRKPVKVLQRFASFHLWTRGALEYLRDNGGPDNLELLTSWPTLNPQPPALINFFADSFAP